MGGAHPGTPVDAFTDVETKSTTVSDVINRALLNTDQEDATIRSVRFAPTIAAAADFCGIASDAFTKVLSRFVDTSSIGPMLLVHVNRDVATAVAVKSSDAACTASFTPRRVQLVCKIDGISRQPQRARATQTRCTQQRNAATMTGSTWRDQSREELREEVRNELLAELVPMLERSTLAAEAALAECKRRNWEFLSKLHASAGLVAADRRAAAADRAAVEHALAQHEGLIDLLRARVRSAEGRSSESVSEA